MDNRDKTDLSSFNYFLIPVFLVLIIICAGTYYIWLWSIATGLQKKIPVNIKMKTSKFKLFFFIPVCYITLFFIGFGTVMNGFTEITANSDESGSGILAGSMIIIFPLHIFSMFCILYILYFVAKTIKTVELQRETKFSDFVGEFFLIWFYPVGVWIIQPKINKMVETATAAA